MIGCSCAVCTSEDLRDRRTRPSAVFTVGKRRLLIDTAPELRLQCLAVGLEDIDALLYTHAHADHIVGLDDVRIFNARRGGPLPVFASAETLRRLQAMFRYAFVDDPAYPSAKPQLTPHEITGPFEFDGVRVLPLPYAHGPTQVLGFRVGNIAYCPDCNALPDATRTLLAGLDVLVLDALRRRPHPTHFNLAQAVAEAHRIGARRTYFTHIAHELGHAAVNAELPAGMELAYDGLVLSSAD
ncbi:MAG: MBL fold metallo-hydrolase [Phycisphaerales bacterium]|nr:MBL fold metallo-hydrolase [Phycisphaerales bacterium]